MARVHSPHLGIQLADIRRKNQRTAEKAKRGARTFRDMELDGTIRCTPPVCLFSTRR